MCKQDIVLVGCSPLLGVAIPKWCVHANVYTYTCVYAMDGYLFAWCVLRIWE